MKKKWLALALATAMVLPFGLSGCGGGGGGETGGSDSEPGGTSDHSDLTVAVLLAGPANDNGWNATAYNALTNLCK